MNREKNKPTPSIMIEQTKPKSFNKKTFILLGILLIFLTGGVMAYRYWWIPKEEEKTPEEIIEDKTANWETYRNEEYGYEIKYPENFGANVWRPLFWPPTTTIVPLNEDPVKKGCPDFPVGIQGATENKVRINNIDYTFYRGSEGAMGSNYTNYCYVTPKGQNYYIVYFVIRSATGCGNNCGSYCGTQYEAECKNLDRVKDIEKPIEKILSTFKFLD